MQAYCSLGTNVRVVLLLFAATAEAVLHAVSMHLEILETQLGVQRSGSWFAEKGALQVDCGVVRFLWWW